jgi:hypothetical protein
MVIKTTSGARPLLACGVGAPAPQAEVAKGAADSSIRVTIRSRVLIVDRTIRRPGSVPQPSTSKKRH